LIKKLRGICFFNAKLSEKLNLILTEKLPYCICAVIGRLLKNLKQMRVIKTKNTKDNLCRYCQNDFATCPKANHILFGNGVGDDNVIECSEFVVTSWQNNFPIEGTDKFAKRVQRSCH
jgi:hypothetical protein